MRKRKLYPASGGIYLNGFLRIVVLVCCLVGTGCMHAYAQERRTLTAEFRDTPLADVLKKLEKLSSYKILFTYDDVQHYKVTASLKNVTITEALQKVLADKPFSFSDITGGKYISVVYRPQEKNGVVKVVKGQVIDEKGESLIGATIRVVHSSTGTVTDAEGHFTLWIPAGVTALEVTFIGMKTQLVPLQGKTELHIVMQPDNTVLSDVVVTGYQTISRERSTASFNIVQGDDMKESATARGSILEGLEGLAPGLSVNLSEDADSKFLVRGLTSINSSQEPLFVVDGVAISGNDLESMLSASDIASVSVLKDATAVSIWGSRAANGIVVVATKKGGNTDGRIRVSYDGNLTLKGKPDIGYYNLMDSRTFIRNVTEVFEMEDYQKAYPWEDISTRSLSDFYFSTDGPVVFPHEAILYAWQRKEISLDERNRQLDVLAARDGYKSYQQEFMSNTWMQNHTLSVSGGTDRFTVFASLGYEGKQGNYHDKDNTYKLNLNQEFKITPWLKWDFTLNAAYWEKKSYLNPLELADIVNMDVMSNMMPYAVFKESDGSWVNFNVYNMYQPKREEVENKFGISMDYFPVEDFYRMTKKQNSTRIRANTGLRLDLWKGIGYEVRLQYLRGSSNSEEYRPEETWHIRKDRISAITSEGKQLLPAKGGDFTVGDAFNTDWTVRNQLTYNADFNDLKHQITALAGCEYRENKTKGYTSFERGYNYQTMTNTWYDMTAVENMTQNYFGKFESAAQDYTKQSETVLRYVSYYANFAYTFAQKYSANGSMRVDQSNLFGTDVNDQFKPIGSVGVSWKMNRESFLENVSWLDNLMLRVSYGFSGNSPKPDAGGPYDILMAYTNTALLGSESGYRVSSPANALLTWEKTRTWNVGIDFDLIGNRLNGSVDWYDKKTTDLLGDKAVNNLTGFDKVYANLGTLSNKGVEISLNSHNIATRNFNWFTTLNIAYNKNKVLKYYKTPDTSVSTALRQKYAEGYAAGAIFGLKWAGLRHEDGVPQVYDHAGNVVYDYNKLTAEDVVYRGSMIPKWNGSFVNRFNYKGFDLSAMFVFNLGHVMRTAENSFFSGRFTFNRSADFDKRWRRPGDEEITDIPSAYEDPASTGRGKWNGNSLYASGDKSIQSASFLKLRELTLGYTLPQTISRKIRAEKVRLRVAAHNVFRVVANDKRIDPEVYSLFTGQRQTQFGAYYSFGLSLNF